jgi:hypothetical protein
MGLFASSEYDDDEESNESSDSIAVNEAKNGLPYINEQYSWIAQTAKITILFR